MHPARANRYAWIGPKLTGSDGNGTKLGYVLPPGGFLKNQRVSLEVSGTAVAIRPVAPATISELEQIRAANEVDGAFNPSDLKDARRRILASIALRQGRSAFRERIVVAYRSVCAVTGCDAVQALEVAHIVPYRGPDTDHVTNGLLLRADIHTLFDLALIAIGPNDYRVLISKSLEGGYYTSLAGQAIHLPADPREHPSRQALELRLKEFQSQQS